MSPRFKILIVDDEPDFRNVLRMRLEASGYDIIEASDGLEGLQSARLNQPNLIILDIMMPKMDGFQVARLLKYDKHYSHIPIIMLTARAGIKDIQSSKGVCVDYYLTKPFKAEELLEDIHKLLKEIRG